MESSNRQGRHEGDLSTGKRRACRMAGLAVLAALAWAPGWNAVRAGEDVDDKARQVLEASIQAMGGQKYLDVKNSVSTGRYFFFKNDRKAFTKYSDWTVYEEPVKSRFQLGKGKRQSVTIYNLELNKGWKLEGEHTVEDVTAEELKEFKRTVKRDLDVILRSRRNDPDVKLFYYGPDDIEGSGTLEAVEALDSDNDSVVIFFDVDSHLPTKLQTHFTDKLGFRHEEETEFYNWHWFDGVQAPLRFDVFVDGEKSQQRFLETLAFNQAIPADYFLEPQVKPKKQ